MQVWVRQEWQFATMMSHSAVLSGRDLQGG